MKTACTAPERTLRLTESPWLEGTSGTRQCIMPPQHVPPSYAIAGLRSRPPSYSTVASAVRSRSVKSVSGTVATDCGSRWTPRYHVAASVTSHGERESSSRGGCSRLS